MTRKPSGQRGPVDHDRREQIITAAHEHFRRYGYKKTTVADLAKAIGLSTAYLYKFFDSKKAIGEAICTLCHDKLLTDIQTVVREDITPPEKLRKTFQSLAHNGADLFIHDRKMHDIVASAIEEKWHAAIAFDQELSSIIRHIILEGREQGEFERKTPIDEACRAITLSLQPIRHPVLLEYNLETLDTDATMIANLVLRSLAP
ncbi:TetR/AcrR family transcriptional regulator [Gluconobacter sp. Dm-74]|uniref:TetR/AcrR family transcriptional regulator n=1 Tax=Gluconobacter cadivus TaxID=2728101 RepID=A0ABR9YUW3_9PROT|nr:MULTISPECIES: TetR/AcrR family transcriptional regulator [Gluconobacter]MBF0888329.1 TetR/AcrR family transcriptional regulator [Gluconobacter cadivus]MBS1059430.1 TetR/AcrR family transcriptional regulator [Gluconobacter sp. Dm-44]MBS1092942.1 TetR/AcrR family transcriptional regulator [Gluconobacter sp. Dm-74]